VLAVVGFHAFPGRVPGGFSGVDVFFVISGYLISSILFKNLERGTFTFADFYARRIKRIFPALIVVLVACFVFAWYICFPAQYRQLGKEMAAGVGFVTNFVLWGESGYFDVSADAKPLLHLWSLGIEEQFYITWPALLYVAWKRPRGALFLIAAIAVLSFGLNVHNIHHDATATFYSPATRFWELLVGAFLAYAHLRPTIWDGKLRFISTTDMAWLADLRSFLGIGLLGIGLMVLNRERDFPGCWALLPTGGAFLLISAGPAAWVNKYVLSNRILVWFGLISFPLYLWHWVVLYFARNLWHLPAFSFSPTGPTIPIRLGAVFMSIALAWLTYRFVEKPMRTDSHVALKVIALCGLLVVLGLMGWATSRTDGFASRFPEAIRPFVDYKYDFASDARARECWVTNTNDYETFSASCLAPTNAKERVVLWGDSHAARFYPGLKRVAAERLAISEFTRDGCPPILGYGSATCIRGNDFVLSKISALVPERVILFAVWSIYDFDWKRDGVVAKSLMATIARLQRAGVTHIVVLGPSPKWEDDLPNLVYRYWKDDVPLHRIPERLNQGLDPVARRVDGALRDLVDHRDRIEYRSLFDTLCTQNGCLTHVPDEPNELITWDYGHLTTFGATFIARNLNF
jgi:peptidoglycan/LPS O-acetylase OafA/YrhL